MLACDKCFEWFADQLPSAATFETNVWLPLGFATACALAINGLGVNKALKVLLATAAVFAIAWSSGKGEAIKAIVETEPSEQACVPHEIDASAPVAAREDAIWIESPSESGDPNLSSAFEQPPQA